MQVTVHPKFQNQQSAIASMLDTFDDSGTLFIEGKRNTIKLFDLEGKTISIKSFKVPNYFNKIAYQFFRKSKARRSFEYADQLLSLGINTPQPYAFAEEFTAMGLGRSFYACEHIDVDLTFRELVEIPDYPDYDLILSQFMTFCFQLHEKGVEFLDHSPGNTLIKKIAEGQYDFYLVDLNRMNFRTAMSFEQRMKNLSHLTPKKEMVAQMSAAYSLLYTQEPQTKINQLLWDYTEAFQKKFHRKIRLKKKFFFWK